MSTNFCEVQLTRRVGPTDNERLITHPGLLQDLMQWARASATGKDVLVVAWAEAGRDHFFEEWQPSMSALLSLDQRLRAIASGDNNYHGEVAVRMVHFTLPRTTTIRLSDQRTYSGWKVEGAFGAVYTGVSANAMTTVAHFSRAAIDALGAFRITPVKLHSVVFRDRASVHNWRGPDMAIWLGQIVESTSFGGAA